MSLKQVTTFFHEVRQEAQKISTPSRRETLMTAFIILALVGILSLVFLLVDATSLKLVNWILGVK